MEQKEGELVIKGESPNEASVTRFGQSMEFSSGMFTNLNIETQREVPQGLVNVPSPANAPVGPNAPSPEVVTFTIKCNYVRPAAQPNAQANPAPTNHVAKN